MRSRPRTRNLLVLGVVLAGLLAACSDDSGSWTDGLRIEAGDSPFELDIDEFELDPFPEGSGVGACIGGIDEPLGEFEGGPRPQPGTSYERGIGNDPYTATGARQVPGPGMKMTIPPSEPVVSVMARPIDPDQHVASRQPDRVNTGPVPAPKVIGSDENQAPDPEPGEPGDEELSCSGGRP